MFHGFVRPGQGFQWFTVLRRENSVSDNGRIAREMITPAGKIAGLLMAASVGDMQQWKGSEAYKQNTHTVLYKIIERGKSGIVKPTDVLELGERQFVVTGIHNPGGLGHFTVYFVEERLDLHGGNLAAGNT